MPAVCLLISLNLLAPVDVFVTLVLSTVGLQQGAFSEICVLSKRTHSYLSCTLTYQIMLLANSYDRCSSDRVVRSMLQKPPPSPFLQIHPAARSCRAKPSSVEGQEAYLAAQNFRVNALIVHVLLDVCCFPLQHAQGCCTTLCCTIDMNA